MKRLTFAQSIRYVASHHDLAIAFLWLGFLFLLVVGVVHG